MDSARCTTEQEIFGEHLEVASAAGEPQTLMCCQVRVHPDLEIFNNVIVLGCEKSFQLPKYEIGEFEPVYNLDELKALAEAKVEDCASNGFTKAESSEDIVAQGNIHLKDLQDQLCSRSLACSKMTGSLPRFTTEIGQRFLYKRSDGTLELNLQGNKLLPCVARINDEDVQSVNIVLQANPDISHVNLSYNNLGDTGLQQFGAVIHELPSLLHLDLSFNDFSEKGLFAFITYLIHCKPLQSLRLAGNMFGDDGFKALACLILSGRCPLQLDVTECDMTPLGFRALCYSLHAIDTRNNVLECFKRDIQLPLELTYLKEARDLLSDGLTRSSDADFSSGKKEMDATEGTQDGHDWTVGCPQEILRVFSQTVLAGLIELSQTLKAESKAPMDANVLAQDVIEVPSDFHCSVVDQICNYLEDKKFDELSERKLETPEDGAIVPRSLYTLDLVSSSSFDDEEQGEKNVHCETQISPGNFYSGCIKSAGILVDEVFDNLSTNQSLNAVMEVRVDVAQTLLMNIAESLEKRSKQKCTSCFDEESLKGIVAESFQKTRMSLMSDCGFKESANLGMDTMQSFLQDVFRSCETALKMASGDPIFLKALTLQCQHANSEYNLMHTKSAPTFADSIQDDGDEANCFNIAASFLHGVCVETAKSIANSDRINIQITDEANTSAGIVLLEMTQKAASVAAEVKRRNNLIKSARTEMEKLADDLVVDIFSEVANEVVSRKNIEDRINSNIDSFRLASKPSCLVLSRPLFHQIADTMAEALGEFLKTNTSVKSLYISKWELRDDGVERLMNNMQYNLSIIVLDLSCNGLGAGSMKCIAKYLTANTFLQTLNISCNPFGDYGMAYLNAAIVETSVKSLNIRNCDITYRQLDRFLDCVSKTNIRTLYIWGNKFADTTIQILECLLNTGILSSDSTDILVQRVENEKFVVNNSPPDYVYSRNTCSSSHEEIRTNTGVEDKNCTF